MVSLESPDTIYDNAIEYYFHEYFENRNIELSGDGYKRVETNVYTGAFNYVYKKLFKPLPNEKMRFNRNSKIDYEDYITIDEIASIFAGLCFDYNIPCKLDMFSVLTGISRMTLTRWETENTRGYIYKDSNGNLINDIQYYILTNGNKGYTREPSTSYCDIIKKIKSNHKLTANNMLYDHSNGQMMIANNDEDADMQFNCKRAVETVQAQRLGVESLPIFSNIGISVGNIAQQNQGLLNVVE